MQICKVEIKLGGDSLNTVVKEEVSVPEVVLLRAIHRGIDSVKILEVTDEREVRSRDEIERLARCYSGATNEKSELWVDVIFPGVGLALPQTLAEIGDSFVPAEPAAKAPRKRKQAEPDISESPE